MLSEPPNGYLVATVARRLDVTGDLAVFWLRTPEALVFRPGQYATLALPGTEGHVVKRPYSIVSAPHEAELELVIERVETGALTPSLFDLHEGDAVWVRRRIVGHFLLDAACTQHVMACTVTGIAPFLSMLRAHAHALTEGTERPPHRFLVLYGASHGIEHGPYRAELEQFAGDWLEAVPTISRPWADLGWTGEVGRVEDVLRKHLDRMGWESEATAGYACGNPQMIENVMGMLARAGLAAARLHEEKYFTEAAGASSEGVVIRTDPLEIAKPPSDPKKPPGGITLKTVPRR